MKILYITFIDFGRGRSGSSVRPQKMYEAFKREGHCVTLLECQQNKRRLRKQRVKKIIHGLRTEVPDICYVEPPAGPFFNRIDLTLLKKIHELHVPIGLFYRDALWLYADWWGVKGLKAAVLRYMHKRDIKVFSTCCDIVYFPSLSMAKLFERYRFTKVDTLPPACENCSTRHKTIQNAMIYVGGVSKAYGTDILLEAYKLLNSGDIRYHLNLVCRKAELENYLSGLSQCEWLHIYHVQDEALLPLYEQSDCGIIPTRKDQYMDFAVHVKMFEYIGNALPIISTDCTETANFIRKTECGIVCRDNADSLAEAIRNFYRDPEKISQLQQNACTAAAENRWTDRVNKVVADLNDCR